MIRTKTEQIHYLASVRDKFIVQPTYPMRLWKTYQPDDYIVAIDGRDLTLDECREEDWAAEIEQWLLIHWQSVLSNRDVFLMGAADLEENWYYDLSIVQRVSGLVEAIEFARSQFASRIFHPYTGVFIDEVAWPKENS